MEPSNIFSNLVIFIVGNLRELGWLGSVFRFNNIGWSHLATRHFNAGPVTQVAGSNPDQHRFTGTRPIGEPQQCLYGIGQLVNQEADNQSL